MRVLSLGVDSVPTDLQKWSSTTAYHHRILSKKLDIAIYVIFSDLVDTCDILSEGSLIVALIPARVPRRRSFIMFIYYALKLGWHYDIDLVISQDIQTVGVLAHIVSKLLKKPLMGNFLGPGIYSKHSESIARWKVQIFKKITGRILKHAKIIRTLNPILKDFLLQEFVISQNKIQIVSDRVDLDLFYPKKKQRKVPVIAVVGRLHHLKGIQFLIMALPIILNEYPDLNCKIVGIGGFIGDLEGLVERLNVRECVEFTGQLPHNQMPSLYNDIDLLVHPSLVEGQSRTILEAMACGIPIVATKTGGIPSIIEHGINGFLIDPKDSKMIAKFVMKILSSDELAEQLGNNARRYAQQYELHQQIQKYFELFNLSRIER